MNVNFCVVWLKGISTIQSYITDIWRIRQEARVTVRRFEFILLIDLQRPCLRQSQKTDGFHIRWP